MVAASSSAGMTIDTERGSANELLYHSVPCDLDSSCPAALSQLSRTTGIVSELRDRAANRLWFRKTDESVFAVAHEFERSTRIGGRHDGLHGKKCLERHVSVVFIERHIYDRQRAGVQRNELVAAGRSGKHNAMGNARLRGGPLGRASLRAVADHNQPERRGNVRERTYRQVGPFHGFEAADEKHVVAVLARMQPVGERRRMVQRPRGDAVESFESFAPCSGRW